MITLSKAENIDARKAIFVTLINAENKKGEDIYFYVAVPGNNALKLQEAMKRGSFDVSKFGTILASGIGKPTKEVVETIEKKFGCKHDNAPEINLNKAN